MIKTQNNVYESQAKIRKRKRTEDEKRTKRSRIRAKEKKKEEKTVRIVREALQTDLYRLFSLN